MTFPKHVLVAIDFAGPSEHALAIALELARPHRAEVTLLHVYTPGRARPDQLPPRSLADATQRLGALSKRMADAGVPITTCLREGNPSATIIAVAEQVGADMIVMGTHARSATAHSLLGSVAEAVIRTASTPVVTVCAPLPKTV